MPDGYSSILISLKNDKKLDETIKNLNEIVDTSQVDVYSWHFTMQRLLQQAESDKAFSKMLLFILYLIVGFGILGTIIMLTNERQKEFRTMISLGMQRTKLMFVTVIELLIMTCIGLIAGLAASYPIALYYHFNPIRLSGEAAQAFIDYGMEPVMPTSIDISIFIAQIVSILIITILASIYPIRVIGKKLTINN